MLLSRRDGQNESSLSADKHYCSREGGDLGMHDLCPLASEWELFVLDPTLPERDSMAQHLAQCLLCQAAVSEYLELWCGISKAGAGRVFSGSTFFLDLIHDEDSDISANRLAAHGIEGKPEVDGVTLATSDRTIWLKAVRDDQTSEIWLYLYSDFEHLIPSNAVVKPLWLDQEFVTDDQGRVNLGQMAWPAQEKMRAEVRLPSATFSLAKIGELDNPSGEVTLTSTQGDRLRIVWLADDRGRRVSLQVLSLAGINSDANVKVAVRAKGQHSCIQLLSLHVDQPTSLEGLEELGQIEIYLYQ